jgi:carboxypeptidase Taq
VPPPLLESYDALKSVVREVTALGEVEGLLSYDEQCFMPPGAAAARAAQKGALATATHALATGGAMRAAVEALRGREGDLPTPRMQANVRLATRAYDQQARKPAALAAREAELESEAFGAWQRARAEADFSLFAPLLEQVVALKREVALVTRPEICGGGGGGGAGGAGVYDGALDSFEVGMRGAALDALFATLRARLLPLLQRIQAKQAAAPGIDAPHAALRAGDGAAEWDVEAQAALSRSVAADMGYSFEHGRLDVSTHPFTGGGGPTDVRITTRFSASNPWEGLGATVHEAGHALYEQGRDMDAEEGARLPASGALSMGVHESQSLLWERLVLQSEECWQYLAPKVHAAFPATAAVAPSDFHRAYNRVCPGLIRVEADEVTCPLHAIDPARQVLSHLLLMHTHDYSFPTHSSARCQPGDVPAARDPALRHRARAHGGRPRGRRRAARLGAADEVGPGAGGARRRRGLPAGHPLVVRRHRLLSVVHARRVAGVPVIQRGGARPGRRGAARAASARRVCAAARVAARARALGGVAGRFRQCTGAPRLWRAALAGAVLGVPRAEVREDLRALISLISDHSIIISL